MRTKVETRDATDLVLQLVGRMHQHFAEVALSIGLTPPQMGVLKNLDDSSPMGRLASELHCDASNITWMVDRLEERGLVERTPDPLDRRVKRLVLTDSGRKLRRDIERRLRAGIPGMENLGAEERRTLGRLLERMLDA
ncbi:MAG TPA: MarR family transcriptional regulator [Actinomycetota bacterium]|jgi:DNA-binding MarR family transcriptional regulator|nr:MarR family transcriptional regulator [Actinomycetota bacterium]